MLSLGMEYDLAFSIAFCSERLAAGSPPPSFAATMIARESFEKSLPRFASAAPFLCLIDDHLLCPDMHPRSRRRQSRRLRSFGALRRVYARYLPYLVQKELVDPRVVGQLRMERSHEDTTLAREHGMPVDLRQHLDLGACVLDPRRADEDGAHRLGLALDVEVCLEA